MNHPKTVKELLALPEELDERLGIRTRGYLFHGSPSADINILEPRQAFHHTEPDGEPAVCAAENPERSIFISLFNRNILDDPLKGGSGWSRGGSEPTIYRATQNVIDAAQTATGHLYLLELNDFDWIELPDPKHGTKRELRSLEVVTPVHKIEVRVSDFPHPVELLDLKNL